MRINTASHQVALFSETAMSSMAYISTLNLNYSLLIGGKLSPHTLLEFPKNAAISFSSASADEETLTQFKNNFLKTIFIKNEPESILKHLVDFPSTIVALTPETSLAAITFIFGLNKPFVFTIRHGVLRKEVLDFINENKQKMHFRFLLDNKTSQCLLSKTYITYIVNNPSPLFLLEINEFYALNLGNSSSTLRFEITHETDLAALKQILKFKFDVTFLCADPTDFAMNVFLQKKTSRRLLFAVTTSTTPNVFLFLKRISHCIIFLYSPTSQRIVNSIPDDAIIQLSNFCNKDYLELLKNKKADRFLLPISSNELSDPKALQYLPTQTPIETLETSVLCHLPAGTEHLLIPMNSINTKETFGKLIQFKQTRPKTKITILEYSSARLGQPVISYSDTLHCVDLSCFESILKTQVSFSDIHSTLLMHKLSEHLFAIMHKCLRALSSSQPPSPHLYGFSASSSSTSSGKRSADGAPADEPPPKRVKLDPNAEKIPAYLLFAQLVLVPNHTDEDIREFVRALSQQEKEYFVHFYYSYTPPPVSTRLPASTGITNTASTPTTPRM